LNKKESKARQAQKPKSYNVRSPMMPHQEKSRPFWMTWKHPSSHPKAPSLAMALYVSAPMMIQDILTT